MAVDDKTIDYVKGRPLAPTGAEWDAAVAYWKTLHSDADAQFDAVVELNAADIVPQVTWAPSPRWCWAWTPACPIPTRKRTPTSAAPSNAR